MATIKDAITLAANELAQGSIDEPRRTASLILQHILEVDRAYLLVNGDDSLPEEKLQSFLSLVERRAIGEPLQYLTGHQEFFGLDFKVTPDVLIPRPETEHLVEQVIKLARERREKSTDNQLIVDVGTGSGCIAVSLAANLPDESFIAIDISNAALAIARENAAKHRVADRISFLQGDLLTPLQSDFEGRVDFIASNPPYVPTLELDHLQREVRDHEPSIALAGGLDGLTFYNRLLTEAPPLLKSGGYLIFEIGFAQLDSIKQRIDSSVWELSEVTADLQGLPRTLTLIRK